jgi:TonB family protein
MFSQLIESNSHTNELKRRGSFVLFTIVTYVVLFAITGVVSIYAYDTHLEEQNYREVMVMRPYELPAPAIVSFDPKPPSGPGRPTQTPLIDAKQPATQTTDRPEAVPTTISTAPGKNVLPPTPRGTGDPMTIDYPFGNDVNGPGFQRFVPSKTIAVLPDEPPPTPTPKPTQDRVVKASQIINSQATYLPKPGYPPLAKQIRLSGSVNVQVLIDETGKVISAKAVSGHPLLIVEAMRAAMNARFSPTTIDGQPVKLSGVIVYNFIMQ